MGGDEHVWAVSVMVCIFVMANPRHKLHHGGQLVLLITLIRLGTHKVDPMGFALLLNAFAIKKDLDGQMVLGIVQGALVGGAGGLGVGSLVPLKIG